MKGYVDGQLRALVKIPMGASMSAPRQEVTCWVDTALNGNLVLPKNVIADLGLQRESISKAILADGCVVSLETFGCSFEWFGNTYQTQVFASDTALPLLGKMLLENHRFIIDYEAKTVELL